MEFKDFKKEFQNNFAKLIEDQTYLFLADVDRDTLWETYLNSFSFEEKQSHNCNVCRSFIKNYGNLVTLVNNEVKTIWDFTATNAEYQVVINNLHTLVKNAVIKDIFVTKEPKLGVDYNFDGPNIVWEHFYYELPNRFINRSADSINSVKGEFRDAKNVFKRSLEELTIDATETVLELIEQNSLYRGQEFKGILEFFLVRQKKYKQLLASQKDNYCWINSINYSALSKIRNSAIGTLLIDISEDVDLDVAVKKFRKVMDPNNYHRVTTTITSKKQVDKAYADIVSLGLEDSLPRRFATLNDVTVSNALFVNRNKKLKDTNIFDELKDSITVNPKKFTKIEEISLTDFITKIVPKAQSIEILLENRHEENLVSLIAPVNPESPSLFKWNNNFSWSYKNALADSSIRENVKAAGGKIDGILRFSIQWNDKGNNNIDFDAHSKISNGEHIYFSAYKKPRIAPSSGQLDLDIMNPQKQIAVENIVWSDFYKMPEGRYTFYVNNYSYSTSNGGFSAEIEYRGEIYSFEYPANLKSKENVLVAEIEFSRAEGIKFIKSLDSNSTFVSKEMWGLNSNKFHKVNMILNSPNYWETNVGNKHIMFMLEGANNTDTVRGFFNEFLKPELIEHRKVFELLGGKMRVEPSIEQLSGLGFSTTSKGNFICKVEGTFSRILRVIV